LVEEDGFEPSVPLTGYPGRAEPFDNAVNGWAGRGLEPGLAEPEADSKTVVKLLIKWRTGRFKTQETREENLDDKHGDIRNNPTERAVGV
jgi:hypothetical protein